MGRTYEIPGSEPLQVEHLLLDVNGTLTRQGKLVAGVTERVRALTRDLQVTLLSSDTLGTLESIGATLEVDTSRVDRGEQKRELVNRLGPERCVAIGNGVNDAAMLESAALGFAIIGPEGASARAVAAADIACHSITVALDLLLDERTLASTLRP